MNKDLERLLIGMMIIGIGGFIATAALADYRHQVPQVTNTYNTIGNDTCAIAGVSGLHRYKVSNKLQGSFAAANCNGVNAASFGVGGQHEGFLYTFTGSADSSDNGYFVGGQIGFDFD